MTKSRLLEVAEAAELIEKVTGLRAGIVEHTAFIKAEQSELAFYDKMGRKLAPFPDMFRRIVDKTAPLVPGGQAFKIVPAVKVDLIELMIALELHTETQAAILTESEKAKDAPKKKLAPDGASWQEQARAIALEYLTKHKANDLHPSQIDVAEHVAKESRKSKIFGPQGKPLSASYIKREAIQGEWWRKNHG